MIVGEFTRELRSMISLTVCKEEGEEVEIEGAIDTGFLGALLLPSRIVRRLNLPPVGREVVILADGSLSELPLYRVTVLWEDEERVTTTYAADTIALVGVELLLDSVGHIEFFQGGEVTIEARD